MRKMTAMALPLLLVLALAGCREERAGEALEDPPPIARSAEQLYVAVSALNGLDSLRDFEEGLRMAGEELGVKTELVGPADYDMSAVAAEIEQAVARQAAGIVVVGWEESLSGPVDRAVELGVPVVTMSIDLPASKRIAFVGASNFGAGLEVGTWVADKLNNKKGGRVALIGMSALPEVRERIEGIRKVFTERGIAIVEISDSRTDAVSSAHAARELLHKYPDLDAIMGVDAHAGLGIGVAVKQAGRSGQILATGWDRNNSLLELVAEGALSGTVVPRTVLMPYYATLLLWQLHNSRVSLTGDDRAAGIRNAPSFIDTGFLIVDQSIAASLLR